MGSRAWLLCGVLAAALAGCGGDDVGDDFDPTADGDWYELGALWDPDRILEVDIELAADDWTALRRQTRGIFDIFAGDCLAEPYGSPFTYFPGTVTINGVTASEVGVRKKGFLGSLSADKPSLKVKIDEYLPGHRLMRQERFTFNNAVQDPGYVNQCIGYQLFRDAGLPAPRCNFARITVNGERLGLYVHVEDVKKAFLRQHFVDDEGHLYEGTLSDFRSDWMGTFERKTNRDAADADDRSDIQAVVDALAIADDDAMAAELATRIDVDQFISFWVVEMILAHWDGYAGNTNNFYIYADPADGRFQFLPWGIDQLLSTDPDAGAGSVLATGALASRLYNAPTTRATYLDRVDQLLNEVWSAPAVQAEIDRMEQLIDPEVPAVEQQAFEERLLALRQVVAGREAAIRGELATPPATTPPLREPLCIAPRGSVSASFSTTWGTLNVQDPFVAGDGTLSVTVDGTPWSFTDIGAAANFGEQGDAVIAVVGAMANGNAALVFVSTDPARLVDGAVIDIDGVDAIGYLFEFVPGQQDPNIIGLLGDGTLTLDQASTTDGQPVTGDIDAVLYEWLF